jgi:hypothetical protein
VLNTEPTPAPDTEQEPKDLESGAGATGHVTWELRGPDGELKGTGHFHNTITQVGDQVLAERAVGITTTAAANGVKLGSGTTAEAKTGAGAALVSYLPDSHIALPAPTSNVVSNKRQLVFTMVWPAGKATAAGNITEAAIVNDYASGTNATSTAANTLARVLLSPTVPSKAAGDSLTLTWTWNIGT